MNILVPYPWLKEHLQTDVSPEKLQRMLSLSGPSVERINTVDGDPVFDIEVTTNRMDMASIRGIAREAGVILPHGRKKAKLLDVPKYEPKSTEITHKTEDMPIKITNDATLCPRIMGVFMDVKIEKSPAWLKKRLEQAGIRSLNNLIDITNYVMVELGQPLHVFDADRLGKEMIIRESRKGEKLTTLDGKTYTLNGGDIVVDNGRGVLTDLIGIMGTENSVVTEKTKRVFLFCEHADPKHIRKTSMSHGIRTNAAQLNEKMIDPNLVVDAILRAIVLYQTAADAKLTSKILDIYSKPEKERTLRYPLSMTERYLGISIPQETQQDILVRLGCGVMKEKDVLAVRIPTFRPDLEVPVDIVEEIARIYGYHNLPSTLMESAIPVAYPEGTDFSAEDMVKQFLADIGLQEVYTYSAVSEALAKQSGVKPENHLRIQNPLTDEHVYMRTTLIPSLLEVLEWNTQRKTLSVFEIANTYVTKSKALPEETLHLGVAMHLPVRNARGVVEALFSRFYLTPTFAPQTSDNVPAYAKQAADISCEGTSVGSFGITRGGVAYVDIVVPKLLSVARKYPEYQPISQYTPIIEHYTFTVPEGKRIGTMRTAMEKSDPRIRSVELLDIFERNFTFSVTYHDKSKQLNTQDVAEVRKHLIRAAKKESGAVLVGKVE